MASRYLYIVLAATLAAACGAATEDPVEELGEDAGAEQVVLPSDAEPTEAEFCEIAFGESGRADVERVLGEPDTTRDTGARALLLYVFSGGNVTIALHLDADVFREFTVYGGHVPACWAEAKRKSLESHRSDAGLDTDPQAE
jgi:hypothetical protein